MAGSYLPPVVQQLTLNISDFLAKIEEAKAAQDDFAAHSAESNEAMRGAGGGSGGAGRPGVGEPNTLQAWQARRAEMDRNAESVGHAAESTERDATATEQLNKHLMSTRELVHGQLPTGVGNLSNLFKNLAQSIQQASNGMGSFGSAFGSLGGIFTGPMGILSSIVGFAKTWAVLVPTLMAAPALLAAIGGAAGGLAGSFTVLSSVIGLFAMGAMKDLSYVTSVSNMAQFDALSAPLQKLYYAYHNLSNEFTIMTQTMGGNSTIIGTLTDMFDTMAVVLQKLGPLMGAAASAVQSGFNVIAASLQGSEFTNFVSWIGAEATPVLTTFAQTFVGLASGWAGLMEDLTPAITLFDNGMVHLTQTFSNWANSPKGRSQVESFVSYVQKAWPEIEKFWQGLGHIFYEFFSSAAKGAPGMAADLGNLFTTIGNALPNLIRFADEILPKIVNGFAQFTGGFFQGFGQSMKGISEAMNGINWRGVGDTMGKIAGDLVSLLPKLIEVVGALATMFIGISKLPGGVWDLVAAWIAFKSVIALGQIVTGIAAIRTGIVGAGTALKGLAGVDAAAPFTAALVPLAEMAAMVGSIYLTWQLMSQKNQVQNQAVVNGLAEPYGRPGLGYHGVQSQSRSTAALWSSQYQQRGNVTGPTNIQSQMTVNIAGPLSPEALAQLDQLRQRQDRLLVQRLQQTRGAFA
ncbi:MAG: hypothetical protein M0027_04315 [Candidatus Dormibacteraeota bacterium]|nr:hypothetical protein [Candidatus Dormibacteraeota bacterium]